MSNSSKTSGDSPNTSPGAPSEKTSGRSGQSPDAGTAGNMAPNAGPGLPSYMRSSVQEPSSGSPTAASSEKRPEVDPTDEKNAPVSAPTVEETTSSAPTIPPPPVSVAAPPAEAAKPELCECPPQDEKVEEQAPASAQEEEPLSPSSPDVVWDDGQTTPKAEQPAAARPTPAQAKPVPAPDTKKASPPLRTPKPSYASFAVTHPVLSIESGMPSSVCSRLFGGLALFPLLPLTIMLVLQTLFTLDARELWFSDEIRHAAAFQNLLDQGKWLILELNGQAYPDKPPLYFLFLRGLYELVRTDGPMLHFTAAAVSSLLYLWAALGLGGLAARVDRRTNLAAGIILLTTGYIMGVEHYARMDLLFSALILCSHIVLYRAFVAPTSKPVGMIIAFVLAGLACLVKGPLGIALPLCSLLLFALWRSSGRQALCVFFSFMAVCFGFLPGMAGLPLLQKFGLLAGATALPPLWAAAFLALPAVILLATCLFSAELRLYAILCLVLMIACFILNGGTPYFTWPLLYSLPLAFIALLLLWQAMPQRLFRLDVYVGLLAGLVPIAAWLGAIYWSTGNLDFIVNSLIKQQVVERAVDTFHHKEAWYYYLTRLPLMLLPWSLLFFFLPWGNFLGKGMRDALSASRRPENEGLAFLWSMVLAALVLLSLLSGKILIYLLPILPALAILAARAVLGLAGARAALFRRCLSLFMLISAVAIVVAALMLFDLLPAPDMLGLPQWKLQTNGAFFLVAAILLLFSALLWTALGSNRPEGVLLVLALAGTALGYPLAGMVAPSFDAVLSPKAQALMMRAYIQDGYKPASFKVYGGTYTYYTGKTIPEIPSAEALPKSESDKMVIGMQRSRLKEWEQKPECFKEVHAQWIETREYVLLACPAKPDLKPAAVPYKPAPDLLGEVLKRMGIQFSAKPATEAPSKAPAATPEKSDTPPAQPKKENAPQAPAEPTKTPPAEAAKPAATPAEPAKSTAPAAEPAKPATSPAEPAKPAAEPAHPASEPAKPTEESAKPAVPPTEPVNPSPAPAEPVKPAAPPAEPAKPAAEPTQPAPTPAEPAKIAPAAEPAPAPEEKPAGAPQASPPAPEKQETPPATDDTGKSEPAPSPGKETPAPAAPNADTAKKTPTPPEQKTASGTSQAEPLPSAPSAQ